VDPSLSALYQIHRGKVSDKWSSYLSLYEAILAHRKPRIRALLEIGVQNGGSLDIWSKFLPDATSIVGCDIDARCAALTYDDPRISVIVGDATQPVARDAILAKRTKFDVVIDDGSHVPKDVIAAFSLYWPHIEPGGLFIAEDLHCDYFPTHQGGIARGDIATRFFAELAHVINFEHWKDEAQLRIIFQRFPSLAGVQMTSVIGTIRSISFHNSVVVIEKAMSSAETLLGERVIVGDVAGVDAEVIAIRERGENGLAQMQATTPLPAQSFANLFAKK
jgi:hypothetical protein